MISSRNRGKLKIGNRVYLNRNTMIVCRDSVEIGSGTTVGPNVMIYDHAFKQLKMGLACAESWGMFVVVLLISKIVGEFAHHLFQLERMFG